ncbi:hypothetical protein JCM3765_006242 [Sporobolomyces pararoseus]
MRSSIAALLSLFLSVFLVGVKGQGVTTLTDVDGATVTTSVSPTVYTTNGEAYTFVPSTPTTPTPFVRSFGSVQNLQDYMASRSQKGVAGSQPPVTATAVVGGGGGRNKQNVVQANSGASFIPSLTSRSWIIGAGIAFYSFNLISL